MVTARVFCRVCSFGGEGSNAHDQDHETAPEETVQRKSGGFPCGASRGLQAGRRAALLPARRVFR
jgi:hypothetical protein